MKRLLIIGLALIVAHICAFAQAPASLEKLFSTYSGEKCVVTVNLNNPGEMLGDDKDDETAKALKEVKYLKILTCDKDDCEDQSFFAKLLGDVKALKLNAEGFEEMMSVNADGSTVKMMYKKNGEKTSDFFMSVIDDSSNIVLIWVSGDNIDLNNVSKLKNFMKGMNGMKGEGKDKHKAKKGD